MADVAEPLRHDEFDRDSVRATAHDSGEYVNRLLAFPPGTGLLEGHLNHGARHPAVIGKQVHTTHADIGDIFGFGPTPSKVVGYDSRNIAARCLSAIAGRGDWIQPMFEPRPEAAWGRFGLDFRLRGREGWFGPDTWTVCRRLNRGWGSLG
jgi:hypothetical protein